MDEAATKIAALWRGYNCRNTCFNNINWDDKLGDYLFRKYYVGLWTMRIVAPGDCVFHGGKHALAFHELLDEEDDARTEYMRLYENDSCDSCDSCDSYDNSCDSYDIFFGLDENMCSMVICDWCSRCIQMNHSYRCIMGCDFDLCHDCYNYKRDTALKNFTEFGEQWQYAVYRC